MTTIRSMNLIVAMDADRGIGKNGKLPWNLRKDMQYFAKVTKIVQDPTKRNAIVMGRKCWQSIPENRKPLAGRLNVVLSRSIPESKDQNLWIMNDFDKMMEVLSLETNIETIWNIGGAEIYDLALEKRMVNEIYVTHIYKRFDTDVSLKSLDFKKLIRVGEKDVENTNNFEEDGVEFEFCRWKVPCE